MNGRHSPTWNCTSWMRHLAQAGNPYSRSWLWIPGSLVSLAPGMTMHRAPVLPQLFLYQRMSHPTSRERSSRKPYLTRRRRVVTAELRGPLRQPLLRDKADQRLHGGAEMAALAHQQVEILVEERDEVEAGGFRRGAGGDAAVGPAGADRGGK